MRVLESGMAGKTPSPAILSHPLEPLTARQRAVGLGVLLALTVLLMAVFGITGAPLTTAAAPWGIVSFEVAGNPQRAAEMVASWDQAAQRAASFGLGIDYLFMPVYATALALGCLQAAAALRSARWPLAGAGAPLAWLAWIAALFDAVENLALWIEMSGPLSPWPEIAWMCASLKFAALFAGLVYSFYGLAVWGIGKMTYARPATGP